MSSSRTWFNIKSAVGARRKNHGQELPTEVNILDRAGAAPRPADQQSADQELQRPNSILMWTKELLEKGPEVFTRDSSATEYEVRIAQLERWLSEVNEDRLTSEHSLRTTQKWTLCNDLRQMTVRIVGSSPNWLKYLLVNAKGCPYNSMFNSCRT